MQKELLICATKGQAEMYQSKVNSDEIICVSVNVLLHKDGISSRHYGVAPALWAQAQYDKTLMNKLMLATEMLNNGRAMLEQHLMID
ncbi:hypothetical protein [Lacticaseibacillus paracasei]|uniref:hypothetical protein n=1 Tax=Lacticaseibacillus paracasei TaxID=1597 RepID=UPI001896E305|nr:hypothetical protein [Lacticaseibacillus paracasei]